MSEQQGNYEAASVVIEPPRKRIERRGKRMQEVEIPAFVKFSTEFKSELADLDVYALKVFLYIGLSINFETETAFPGVRKIAADTKMDKDTVSKAVDELEEKGLLQVWRREGASNIYKPALYFAIGDSVPPRRTVPQLSPAEPELSRENGKLSPENTKLSPDSRVNRAQQEEQDLKQKERELTSSLTSKDKLLAFLQQWAVYSFPDYKDWHKLKLRLEAPDIAITGYINGGVPNIAAPTLLTISGLSGRIDQFSEAEVFTHRYYRSFSNVGIDITFEE